jgi:large subunit ribosomal protein L13
MKTRTVKPDEIEQKWYLIDAADKTLGRLATRVAGLLRGKHKPEYTPNMDLGDYVIIVNAAKIHVTGNKVEDKMYYHHSGYPGGIKSINFEKLLAKKPEFIIEKAVKGMLPKGPLGRKMFKKLKVYAGAEHQHSAQQPELLDIEAE